jgi:hypothetical protein
MPAGLKPFRTLALDCILLTSFALLGTGCHSLFDTATSSSATSAGPNTPSGTPGAQSPATPQSPSHPSSGNGVSNTAPTPSTAPSTAPSQSTTATPVENLIEDPGFESGVSGFAPNQKGTSVDLVQAGALSGKQSLKIGIGGYGDSVVWDGRDISGYAINKSKLMTISAHVKATVASSSQIQLCGVVTYVGQSDEIRACATTSGAAGDKGMLTASTALDPAKTIAHASFRIYQVGGSALSGVIVDDVSLVLAGIYPTSPVSSSGGSSTGGTSVGTSSGSSSGSSGSGDTGSPAPTFSGTPYPGYTYALPVQRPFISLKDYDSADKNGAAYGRLKNSVDDVVRLTANWMAANSNYAALVKQLDGDHYDYSAVDSIVMYHLSGDPKYIQQAISMEDAFISSENALIAAGKAPAIAGDSYLEVGQTLEQVALTYDYGFDMLRTEQRQAWAAYAEQAVYNVWHPQQASWGGKPMPWSGWATNDPGDNYYYSFLKATQLWALASQERDWFTFLQTQKYPQLVPYMSQLVGGGSREGTGYGTSHMSLFENYRYWKSSTGEDLSKITTETRDDIDYWVHATVPTREYFAPIGDQARTSMPEIFDYQRRLVEEAVNLNHGTPQASRGMWWLSNVSVRSMEHVYDYRYDLLASAQDKAVQPTALVYDATGVGAIFARSDWSTSASWLATVAGPYDQSHAHQEQGGFTFYKGTWLAVTSNVWSHSGLHQETGAQNVVRFVSGGADIPQKDNTVSTHAVSTAAGVTTISEDLSPAYAGSGGKVTRWKRTLTYTAASHLLNIQDTCAIAAGVQPIFQVHVPAQPTVDAKGTVTAGNLTITPLQPSGAAVTVVSMHDLDGDYDSGYRVEITPPAGNTSCAFSVNLQAK